ncbi:hypothetical protein [Sediminispirochaeta bajacaliforniensis]|uniref:hypothetical protein n=1 Tax=Sediminispirochaeta bajacaliforniensis TaxID=148 RepID=UPI000373D346|nr:hypothetical protein [Sediminispirochaeta bajacaliforniensis]
MSKEKKKTNNSKNPPRPYPRIVLSEALKVGTVIKELNGGNPWAPSDIARAIVNTGMKLQFFIGVKLQSSGKNL